jgi:serine-type anaerobic sulfatase-maturating enzyme
MTTEQASVNKNKEGTPQGIHVVAKPIGPVCNLNCEYCFYFEKQA